MKYIILIIVSIFIIGCNSNTKGLAPPKGERVPINSQFYKEGRDKLIPEECFSHFPVSVSSPYLLQESTDDMASAYSYMLYTYGCNTDTLEYLRQHLKTIVIRSYSSTDSTMLILKKNYNYQAIKERIIRGEALIPYFEEEDISNENIKLPDFFSSETISGLSPGFEIFVIESESIYHAKETKREDVFKQLPRTKNEVYSRGICLNMKYKYAIFWTIFF